MTEAAKPPGDLSLYEELVGDAAKKAIERARAKKTSFAVRAYECPGPTKRVLVSVGEAHLKLEAASEIGKALVGGFELRGVETFQRKDVLLGGVLGLLIHLPRQVLRAVAMGRVKDSTIVDAKALSFGHTVELEKTEVVPAALHAASVYLVVFFVVAWVELLLMIAGFFSGNLEARLAPAMSTLTYASWVIQLHLLMLFPAWLLRKKSWAWLVHPAIGLVTARDTLMADGTVRMLAAHPGPSSAVVVMGRAHLPGYEQELVERHGFRRIF